MFFLEISKINLKNVEFFCGNLHESTVALKLQLIFWFFVSRDLQEHQVFQDLQVSQ